MRHLYQILPGPEKIQIVKAEMILAEVYTGNLINRFSEAERLCDMLWDSYYEALEFDVHDLAQIDQQHLFAVLRFPLLPPPPPSSTHYHHTMIYPSL